MEEILLPVLTPILILTSGALLLPLLGAWQRMRGLCLVATGVAGLALIALWRLGIIRPVDWIAPSWRPLVLFGAPLAFEVADSSWALTLALVATTFLSLVACCTRANRPGASSLALILGAFEALSRSY